MAGDTEDRVRHKGVPSMIETKLSFARTMTASVLGVALGLAVFSAEPANAADDFVSEVSTSSWTISGGAAVTSDYVFRGITQSDEHAAIQGYGEIGYGMFYAGIWGSSVDFAGGAEIDPYFGFRPSWGIASFDFGVIIYHYPGDPAVPDGDFVELKGAVSVPVGEMVTLGGVIYYSPDYYAETGDSVALEGSVEVALPHNFAISGMLGHQWIDDNVGFGTPDYLYWNIGASYTWRELTFDLRYHDTDMSNAVCFDLCDERVVGTVSVDFSTP